MSLNLLSFTQIAVVSQDCVLFARPIRENIAYGLEDVPEEEIHRAAKLASAHDFIRKLPNGYDTGANPADGCLGLASELASAGECQACTDVQKGGKETVR